MPSSIRFQFKPVDSAHRDLVHKWLKQPYIAEWFYGQGLANTIKHLDEFLQGAAQSQYWLAYDDDHPFAFLITSWIAEDDPLTRWRKEKGPAITLDMLIGDPNYLGKGYACTLVHEFLRKEFPQVTEVLIDPEATNVRAIHVYEKIGFKIVAEFIPSHSPHPHYQMRLSTKTINSQKVEQ